MPLRRPTLLPGLARAWRGPHTLQLGADSPRAISIDLPDPRVARMLDLLDGRRTERAVLTRIAADGSSAEDARVLLNALHAAGFVLPAADLLPPALPEAARQRLIGEATVLALDRPPDRPPPGQILRRRAAARIVITGTGRLAAPIAVALAEAGAGQIHADVAGAVLPSELPGGPLRSGDVGLPRAEAIAAAIRRAAPQTGTRAVRRGAATLVVQLGYAEPAALLAAAHAQRRQAHLVVALRDGSVVVGPLVRPGGGPCLNCLELHRRDRDPGRPAPAGPYSATAEPCAVATLLAGTGYAVAEALAFLDGGSPATLGASVEIAAPGRTRRRTWAPHPDCRCGRRPRRRTGGPAPPERLKAEPSVTMAW
jgi:bacteriocin biosynthesis cyclodehydratase domain-containing protein